MVWGPRLKQLPQVASGQVQVLGTGIGWHDIFIIAVTPAVLLLLALFLKRAKLGLALRAVEQNCDAALLMGIDPTAIFRLTFAVSSGFAALAGVLLGGIFFLTPTMGDDPLLKAFIVIVFGGLGSIGGTIAGAYVIGIIESASSFFFGLYVTPALLFIVMIIVMLVRPSGLFGRPE